MPDERAIARYRRWYRQLIRLHSKPHRERFAESMEQTFNDLLRERSQAGKGFFGCALWLFVETSFGIVKENIRHFTMQTLAKATEGSVSRYRAAVGVAAAAALLQIWMNLAVATEEDNSGGLMFVAVLVLGGGAAIARLRPQGMVLALVATAAAQAVVAAVAMIAWGQYVEFAILHGFFMALWIGSALLFRGAADPWSDAQGGVRASGANGGGVAE